MFKKVMILNFMFFIGACQTKNTQQKKKKHNESKFNMVGDLPDDDPKKIYKCEFRHYPTNNRTGWKLRRGIYSSVPYNNIYELTEDTDGIDLHNVKFVNERDPDDIIYVRSFIKKDLFDHTQNKRTGSSFLCPKYLPIICCLARRGFPWGLSLLL